MQKALQNASSGRTTLIIAHRLSTIRAADLIAVLHRGHIVEIGSHDQLMQKRRRYFRLVQLQNRKQGSTEPISHQRSNELAGMRQDACNVERTLDSEEHKHCDYKTDDDISIPDGTLN